MLILFESFTKAARELSRLDALPVWLHVPVMFYR